MSGVGRVADETLLTREVAKAMFAETKSVQGAVATMVASLSAQADATTAHVVEILTGRIQEVAAHSDAQVFVVRLF